jgi:hypothetical protein
MLYKSIFALFFAVAATFGSATEVGKDFPCGDYNNNCLSCIQATEHNLHTCSFCPVDMMCHTVGSLFNKCSSDECISLSATSSCEKKTANDCSYSDKYYALRGNNA